MQVSAVNLRHSGGPHIQLGRLALLALLVAMAAIWSTAIDSGGGLSALNHATAQSVYGLLGVLGLPAALDGATLMHPAGFGMRIETACTILVPSLAMAALLAVLPLSGVRCVSGIIVGAVLLWGLNSFRLAGLFFTGIYAPGRFALTHDWIGQAMIVASVVFFLVLWTRPPTQAS